MVLATGLLSVSVAAGAPANSLPNGQCTWWVYKMLVQTGNVGAATTINDWTRPRDAYTWRDKAKASGWSTGTVPKVGAIAWWPKAGPYIDAGHVAFVEAVVDATHARISESNYPRVGHQ